MENKKKKPITNPFQIGFKAPSDETVKEMLAKLPTDQRIKFQDMLDKQSEDAILANKALLAGFVNGAVFNLLTAGDTEVSRKIEELKKKAPEAFTAGEIGSMFVPFTPSAKAASAGAKLGSTIGKKILGSAPGAVRKGIADITRFGLEGAGSVAFNDALNTEKMMKAYKENGGDLMKALTQRINEVKDVASEGFAWGAGTGALVKISTLPIQKQQKNIEMLNRELEVGKKIEYRKKGPEQKEIAKFLNIPKKQSDAFFDTYGMEIEDVLAGLELPESKISKTFTGTQEELQAMSKFTGKGKTFMDKYSSAEDMLLKSPKLQEKIKMADINNMFEGAFREANIAGDVDPKLKKEMISYIDNFRSSITPNMTYADLAKKMDSFNKVARNFKQQQKIGQASIAEQIGKGMRRVVNEKSGGQFNEVNAKKRALMIADENLGTAIASRGKGTTLQDLSRGPVTSAALDLTEKAASTLGLDSRDLTDMLGTTTLKSKTLNNFQKILKNEQELKSQIQSKGIEQMRMPGKQAKVLEENLPSLGAAIGVKKTEPSVPMEAPAETSMDVDSILNDLGIPGEETKQAAPTEPTKEVSSPTLEVDSILDDLGV